MISFTVLGGYLGAGKTTLVNQILRNNNTSVDKVQRIALLVNDFGDINIDAQLIESQTETQINLANGCICCTLNDGFSDALDKLIALDPQPDHIIVEASGVADVNNLSQYGNGKELSLASVIVVADADSVQDKASDKYVARTIQRQLKTADLILLNKVDLLTEDRRRALMKWLADLTEDVPIVPCVNCDVPIDVILNLDPRSAQADACVHEHEHYDSWAYCFSGSATRTALELFAEEIGPEVLRLKGLFAAEGGGTFSLQIVGKRKEIKMLESRERSDCQLVAIGLRDDFVPDILDALAAKLFGSSVDLRH
ncbi:MAG: G3E family GTPase [Candidatus Azotimanducaceae bacterium]|jgi:G3E family GTPase